MRRTAVVLALSVLFGLFPFASPAAAAPVLNEFVARPAGGEGEWVELTNPGPDPCRLDGWTLADGTGKTRTIAGAPVLAPGAFLILASRPDSLRLAYDLGDTVAVIRPDGWPILNDHDGSGGAPADLIVLRDAAGAVVDSVAYFESWLPPDAGWSLERVGAVLRATDPGTWGWCQDPRGATPGRRNSLVSSAEGEPRGALEGPREVEPGRRPAVFDYRLPGPGTLALWLLDPEGREVAVLRPPAEAPAAGRWVWGSDGALPPRSGLYFLCLRWRAEDHAPVGACRSLWVTR